MSIEAMKQALEALVSSTGELRLRLASPTDAQLIKNERTINALRQAIAEAEKQEPVAWLIQYSDRHEFVWGKKPEFLSAIFVGKTVLAAEPLYTAPVHASDISQECVDETAKDRHEPDEDIYDIWKEKNK